MKLRRTYVDKALYCIKNEEVKKDVQKTRKKDFGME